MDSYKSYFFRNSKMKLFDEAAAHDDIIIENFKDVYNNLTLKTGFILKNYKSLCFNSSFLMKTDDDMFVNTKLLEELLSNSTQSSQIDKYLIGDEIAPYKPHRDRESRWYLPRFLMPDDLLPSYLSGTGYIISSKMYVIFLNLNKNIFFYRKRSGTNI